MLEDIGSPRILFDAAENRIEDRIREATIVLADRLPQPAESFFHIAAVRVDHTHDGQGALLEFGVPKTASPSKVFFFLPIVREA